MATVYKIKVKTVSFYCNYDEKTMTEIVEKMFKDYIDKKTGLGFEKTEIDVERV
jgi:hypothetical protein